MQTNGRERSSVPRSRPNLSLLYSECRSHSIQRHYRYFLPVYVPAFAAITSAVNRSSTNSLPRSGGLPVFGMSVDRYARAVRATKSSLASGISLSHAMTFSLLACSLASQRIPHTDPSAHFDLSAPGYRFTGTHSSVQCPRDCHARRISLSDQQRRHVIELLRRQGRWLHTVPATASTASPDD
jgi:hypothetical protein